MACCFAALRSDRKDFSKAQTTFTKRLVVSSEERYRHIVNFEQGNFHLSIKKFVRKRAFQRTT
jgi:hypothetical protein